MPDKPSNKPAPKAQAASSSDAPATGWAGYFEETRRPVYSAVLVLPFLAIYEIGMLVLRPDVINGGDAIIRRLLGAGDRLLHSLFGNFPIHFSSCSVFVLLIVFMIWQHYSKASRKIDPAKLTLLFAESLCFALLLYWVNDWLALNLGACTTVPSAALAAASEGSQTAMRSHLLELTLYCGAGVYEEFVFRVLLLGLLLLVFEKLFSLDLPVAAFWSVLLAALLFSAFHYGPGGDKFEWNSFLQRAFAGLYFSTLFVTRSFGVAAAAHALYDIRVGFGGH